MRRRRCASVRVHDFRQGPQLLAVVVGFAKDASQFLAPLISTRLQPGVAEREESGSRFNGFGGGTATSAAEKTAKAVVSIPIPKHPAEAGC